MCHIMACIALSFARDISSYIFIFLATTFVRFRSVYIYILTVREQFISNFNMPRLFVNSEWWPSVIPVYVMH